MGDEPTVYVALWVDRHADTEAHVFSSADTAISWARSKAREYDRHGELNEELTESMWDAGWLYYGCGECPVGCAGGGAGAELGEGAAGVSRIYFHTQHEGTAELLGAERAYMGLLCADLAASVIPSWPEAVFPHLTPDARSIFATEERRTRFSLDLPLYLNHEDRPIFQCNGEPLDSFPLMLNTVLALGNDPVCLFARLHGQCERHAYVEGPDRSWLAGVIQQGLDCGIYRQTVSTTEPDGTRHSRVQSGAHRQQRVRMN